MMNGKHPVSGNLQGEPERVYPPLPVRERQWEAREGMRAIHRALGAKKEPVAGQATVEDAEQEVTQSAVHQRAKEIKLSQIGLYIVAVFISCHSFKWIPNIYELQQSGLGMEEFDWPTWIRK